MEEWFTRSNCKSGGKLLSGSKNEGLGEIILSKELLVKIGKH